MLLVYYFNYISYVLFFSIFRQSTSEHSDFEMHDAHHHGLLDSASGPVFEVGQHANDEEFHKHEDDSVAQSLKQKVRVSSCK